MTKRLKNYQKALEVCWKQFEVVNARRAKVVKRLEAEQEKTDRKKMSNGGVDWPWLLKIDGQSTAKWQERKKQLALLSGLNEFQFGSMGRWNDIDQAAIEIAFKRRDPFRTALIYQAIMKLLPHIKPLKDGFKWFQIKKGGDDYAVYYLLIRPEDEYAKIMRNSSIYRDWMPLMKALKFCESAIYYDWED